jgi:16S rRNA (cytidine1402-2'-O)-methyltransferase
MSGVLYLLPTPIDLEHKLEELTFGQISEMCLNDDTMILVEEAKECRRRWLHFGLPREAIAKMVEFNEHTVASLNPEILEKLKNNHNVILMSDCGTPAWMDPGQELVHLCHQHEIKVTAFNLNNSLILSLILSGIKTEEFHFFGFPPKTDREQFWQRVWNSNMTSVVMDTPYRLQKVIQEMKEIALRTKKDKLVFIGLNLNSQEEVLIRKNISKMPNLEGKHEFMIVIGN